MKLFVVLAAFSVASCLANELGRGFGDEYDWFKLEEGLAEVKATGKPGMMVVHKSWCGACKRLGPNFSVADGIKNNAKNFVMINVHDDEEPKDAQYGPDGTYIPRIFFIGPDGNVNAGLYNVGGNDKFKYFYGGPSQVVKAMENAQKYYSKDEL